VSCHLLPAKFELHLVHAIILNHNNFHEQLLQIENIYQTNCYPLKNSSNSQIMKWLLVMVMQLSEARKRSECEVIMAVLSIINFILVPN